MRFDSFSFGSKTIGVGCHPRRLPHSREHKTSGAWATNGSTIDDRSLPLLSLGSQSSCQMGRRAPPPFVAKPSEHGLF